MFDLRSAMSLRRYSVPPLEFLTSCRFWRASGSKSFIVRNRNSALNSVSSAPACPLKFNAGWNLAKASFGSSTLVSSSFSEVASLPTRSRVIGIITAQVEVGTLRTAGVTPLRMTLIKGMNTLLSALPAHYKILARPFPDEFGLAGTACLGLLFFLVRHLNTFAIHRAYHFFRKCSGRPS